MPRPATVPDVLIDVSRTTYFLESLFFHAFRPPDAAASPKKLKEIIFTPKKIRYFQLLGTLIIHPSYSFRI
jgi:hypothetical protein